MHTLQRVCSQMCTLMSKKYLCNVHTCSSDFYNKLEKLNVQAGERDKILLAHVQRICEAHDTVMRSYYQQINGSCGADATTSMENIGEQVYVQVTHNFVSSAVEER